MKCYIDVISLGLLDASRASCFWEGQFETIQKVINNYGVCTLKKYLNTSNIASRKASLENISTTHIEGWLKTYRRMLSLIYIMYIASWY